MKHRMTLSSTASYGVNSDSSPVSFNKYASVPPVSASPPPSQQQGEAGREAQRLLADYTSPAWNNEMRKGPALCAAPSASADEVFCTSYCCAVLSKAVSYTGSLCEWSTWGAERALRLPEIYF